MVTSVLEILHMAFIYLLFLLSSLFYVRPYFIIIIIIIIGISISIILLESYKDTNHQVLIKSQQNRFKQVVEKFALRSKNLLILFRIRRNLLRSRSSRSLYLSVRKAIKQIVVIIGAYHFSQLRTKVYPTSCCQG